MQAAGFLRRSLRAVRAPTVSLFDRFLSPEALLASGEASAVPFSESRFLSTYSLHNHAFSVSSTNQCGWQSPPRSMVLTATFCTAPDQTDSGATEAVKEIYDKMLHSVKEMRSAPPNAWIWTLIENCKNKEDIALLFDLLRNLRVFRLSNLRIHDNFNCNLCQQITKTCIRVGAIDFDLSVCLFAKQTYLVHSTSNDEKQLHLCYLVGEFTGSVVVFTNSVASSVHLHKLTALLGYKSEVLNSRMNSVRRRQVVANFVDGSNRILFSTNGNQQKLTADTMIYFELPHTDEHLEHTKALEAGGEGGTIVFLGARNEVGLIEAGVRTYPIDVSSLPTLEERLSKARQTITIKARAGMGEIRSESAQKRKAKSQRKARR